MMPTKRYRWPSTFLVLGVIVISFAIWTKVQLTGYQEAEAVRVSAADDRYAELLANDRVAKDAVATALVEGSITSLERATAAVESVSDPLRKQLFLGTLLPKRIEAYGSARDEILTKAAELQELNLDDPQVAALVEQARPLQEKTMALLVDLERNIEAMRTQLSPEEWRKWRAAMRYLEGYTEYSRLNFLKSDEQQKAKEIIQKSLDAYGKIFIDLPKDARAEYAIEALYQEAKKQPQDGQGKQGGGGKKPSLIKRPSGPSSRGIPDQGI